MVEQTLPANGSVHGDDETGISRVDLRTLMPETGLKEYWYPALFAKDVRKKPKLLKIVDQEIVLWRGKKDIIAFDNACAHRGGMLHKGDCWWPGTISCFYHGWTYNEEGEMVASLSEGPDCKIPGQVRIRKFPTRTLHGVVFIWTGDGEPAPIEEDVPPQFLDESTLILGTSIYWNTCNWRQALENIGDSHFPYLHRNSFREAKYPIKKGSPRAARPQVINGRGLVNRRAPGDAQVFRAPTKDEDYQSYFPALDAKWPKFKWRFAWTWLVAALDRAHKSPLTYRSSNPEWPSTHLPGIHENTKNYVFTRWVIPVGAGKTRLFYFHTTKPATLLGRLYEMAVFYGWRNWLQNYNFSGQDGEANTYLYYDRPEYLSATDLHTVEWRRLVMRSRDFITTASSQNGNGHAASEETPTAEVPLAAPSVPNPG